MQRRDFFQSFTYTRDEKSIPPPYKKEPLNHCNTCEAPCISVCETKVLYKNAKSEIAVSFETSGCTYCQACANVCEKEVLSLDVRPYIQAVLYIDETLCVAHNGTICMSCKEPCLENAIVFKGLFAPKIEPSLCTSCGYCVARCPSSAIMVAA